MSDSKALYSEASGVFIEEEVIDQEWANRLYERSKAREAKYNDRWMANRVNINDVVERFAPESKGERLGVKYIYKGKRANVVADMASGYLRIQDSKTGKYLKLDGTFGNGNQTHFKIMRREEM